MKNSRCRTTNLVRMPKQSKESYLHDLYVCQLTAWGERASKTETKKVKNVSERVFHAIMNGSAVSIVKCLDSMTRTNNEQVEQMLQIHDNNIKREAAHKDNGNNRIRRKKNSTKRNENSQKKTIRNWKRRASNQSRDRAKWNIEKFEMKYMRVEMCVCVCLHFVCFHWCEAADLIK